MNGFWFMVIVVLVYAALFGNLNIPEEDTFPFFLIAFFLTMAVVGLVSWISEQITKKRGP